MFVYLSETDAGNRDRRCLPDCLFLSFFFFKSKRKVQNTSHEALCERKSDDEMCKKKNKKRENIGSKSDWFFNASFSGGQTRSSRTAHIRYDDVYDDKC